MIIDRPHTADIPALRQLWKQAFGDSDSFLDGFFRTSFSPNRCRCVTLSGQLTAALYWFDCQWEGKKVAYLYAVATDEKFRGKGLCRALMEDTHRHLKTLGYAGAALVPGNEDLFALYEKLGYTAFCPTQTVTVEAESTSAKMQSVNADVYWQLRKGYLPADAIIQDTEALAFAATFCDFYAGENMLMCLSQEGDTLCFQEYLGDPTFLGGVINALNGKKAIVRLPGGSPFAMYHGFNKSQHLPAYFEIPLN